MFKSKRPGSHRGLHILLGVLIGMLMLGPIVAFGQAGVETRLSGIADAETPSSVQPAAPDAELPTHFIQLPFISMLSLSDRLGFGLALGGLNQYPEVASLKAGWYLDWGVKEYPLRPNGMEYVQVVRVHQNLTCPLNSTNAWNRTLCPYVVPYSYSYRPSADAITRAAKANPGALWLIGNEMDRRDWPGGGQDEMLPEVYATAYHDLYNLIKGMDPKARIAIGGMIQATPLRLEYLTKVWNAYAAQWGPMPVDVWNVHNFILKEDINDYGASIPPGSTASTGVLYPVEVGGDTNHVNMTIFAQQIRAFRTWMKEHQQQDKPLVVSEYGVLYRHAGLNDPTVVQNFMIATFDYFLNTKDCSLGYAADGCRLVQTWAWYSLDDDGAVTGLNQFSNLFSPGSFAITSTGMKFREYSLANVTKLKR